MLARFGLEGRENESPSNLSGGQQQRVAIARAFAARPRAMLLDEVTSALDPELVGEVLRAVRDLKEEGVTMLIATHEMSFAREVADTVGFLHEGRLVEVGPPEQVLESPRGPEHPEVPPPPARGRPGLDVGMRATDGVTGTFRQPGVADESSPRHGQTGSASRDPPSRRYSAKRSARRSTRRPERRGVPGRLDLALRRRVGEQIDDAGELVGAAEVLGVRAAGVEEVGDEPGDRDARLEVGVDQLGVDAVAGREEAVLGDHLLARRSPSRSRSPPRPRA